MKNLVLFLSLLLIHPGQIRAGISDNAAVKAIAGEAEGEGPRGMLAVACALRNRGTLKGVYGLQAARIRAGMVNPSVIRTARWAWRESKKRDITGGADHWHNLKREGENYWTRKLVKTVVISNHVFYKERSQCSTGKNTIRKIKKSLKTGQKSGIKTIEKKHLNDSKSQIKSGRKRIKNAFVK